MHQNAEVEQRNYFYTHQEKLDEKLSIGAFDNRAEPRLVFPQFIQRNRQSVSLANHTNYGLFISLMDDWLQSRETRVAGGVKIHREPIGYQKHIRYELTKKITCLVQVGRLRNQNGLFFFSRTAAGTEPLIIYGVG